jgi:hypothetical protein
MKLNSIKTYLVATGIVAVGIYAGCKPEKFGEGNGLSSPNLNASFTVTPVANKANYYVLKADETGVLAVKWDLGDGAGSAVGKATDTVFYPDAGKYTITLTTVGKGGTQKTASQDVTVATSDPVAGNLVLGGNMAASDDAYWTHLTFSAGVTMSISDGKMVAIGGNGGHAAVAQAIDVIGGKKYKVDMLVSGSGATDTWFEVYVDTKVPQNGVDYPSSNKLISLNTWAGCGKTAFSGKLSALSCSGVDSKNVFSFPNSGKVYLVIKSGGSNLGVTGISFTKVEFRGTN